MSTEYKPISELEKSEVAVSLDDLILISHPIGSSGTENGYKSNKTEVRNFVGTLSSEVVEPLSVEILKPLKKLAFMDPDQLNTDPDITAFVKKDTNIIRTEGFSAISAIHWTEGTIDRVESVSLDDVKAKVTDINTTGDPIAKIDGTQIYNGLSVEQVTKQGFEIAKVNGTSIYGGQDNTTVQNIASKGNDIAKVIKTSPNGQTEYTIKNGIEVVPTNANGHTSLVGQEIFKVNDIPVYNNLSVTSLVSNKNLLSDPIADINGNKIYNGVVLLNVSNIGLTIATINGTAIKNGLNIDPNDFKTVVNINDNLKGTTIATFDGKTLKNGVNVDVEYDAKTGVKIANIANTDVYAPGTDISVIATIGTKIANVKTATGKLVDLFSGEHPHVHLTQAEYDELKTKKSLDPNTYYFTEGRTGDTGYDDVGFVYRYKNDTNAKGEFKWFELWPDGWCRLGGMQAQTKSNSTETVKMLVSFKTKDYCLQITRQNPTGCAAPRNSSNVVMGTLKTDEFQYIGVCGAAHTNVCWIAEGYYDVVKLNDILKTYSTYTTTLIGITNIKQSIVGGNAVVGLIVAYGGTDTPNGWLLCDGTAVDKTTYTELYAVIGDKFGTSKDTTKFILPKLTDSRYLQGYVTPGTLYSDGLPNITGNIANTGFYGTAQGSGALSRSNIWQNSFTPDRANDNTEVYGTLNFNAAGSNSIYGAATSVRPKSLTVRYLICWKATDAGNGGGVIDGTLCKDKVIMSAAATATKLEYIVDNDCLLVIENVGTDFTNYSTGVYVNGSLIASLINQFGGTYTKDRVLCLIPVKKGSLITLQDIDDPTKKIWSEAATVAFYEYLLKSMNPLIAMPDYDATPINVTNGWKAALNGWIVTNYNDSTITSKSVLGHLTINDRKVWSFSWEVDGDNNCQTTVIPISVNDIVKWYNDTYNRVSISFYPCKPVPQKDCASYCIESKREGSNWCRVYSDGWCEQGGMFVTSKTTGNYDYKDITFIKTFANTQFTLITTVGKTKSGNTPCADTAALVENVGARTKSSASVSYVRDLGSGGNENTSYVLWEAKGWIK